MFFLEDPNKRPVLWESLHSRLAVEEVCYVVQEGRGALVEAARVLDPATSAGLEQRLRRLHIQRIGASHGTAIAPHFGLELHGDKATVVEYVTYPSRGQTNASEKQVQREIGVLATDIFYFHPGVHSLLVPLEVTPWEMEEAVCEIGDAIIRITRRPTS
jgi:hypothetical protein